MENSCQKITPQIMADEKKNSGSVPLLDLLLQISPQNTGNVFYVIEGNDDIHYYYTKISQICTDRKLIPIIAHNKKNVIYLRDEVKNRSYDSKYNICFFIDKDYDRNKHIESIYMTPGYSMENFYCSKDVLEKVLILYFISDNNTLHEKITALFDQKYAKFIDSVSLFCAWFFILKRLDVASISFDNEYERIFKIEPDCSISADYSLDDLKKIQYDNHIRNNNIYALKRYIIKHPQMIKGKYIFEFYSKFISYIKNMWNKKDGTFKCVHSSKCRFNTGRPEILSSIAILAEFPDDLKLYIKNRIVN